MGVHGLWDLLSPVGRRVSVETLAGKRLAIDASIWMIQFMKAMRDERGEMVRNAHILGFFRRICKLLFLRTKPVFVFDGATPALKRRTVIARRRQRENAQAKIRKTAEKLLLNHIKAMRLKELANDLEDQRKSNGDKGKKVITDKDDFAGTTLNMNPPDTTKIDQEALDAMLAASIEAEESEGFIGEASTSGAGVLEEDEDGDDDEEEMLLPTLHGKVDPAVLASLPPSMQLDLLGQMRERLMAENRQKYQKVKKAPARFSELQIESYLKTVAFRREINEVQKAAGGRGINGVQTSRIASEANREFIFSNSFTGNRQSLASAGVEANNQILTSNGSTKKSNGIFESFINEPKKAFDKDVESYRDERGRVRMSKMKAMGIQMTRDLQRNLDLMKEIEQDNIESVSKTTDKTASSSKLPEGSNKTEESIPVSGISIEVSLEDDNQQQFVDSYDDVFAQFVVDNTSSKKQPIIVSDCVSDESEVEWEEGPSGSTPEVGPTCEIEHKETVSKGELLEELDFQEAIRRSMEEIKCQKDIDEPFVTEEFKDDDKNMDINASIGSKLPSESVIPDKLFVNVNETEVNELELNTLNDPDLMEIQMVKSNQSDLKHEQEISTKSANNDLNELDEDNCKVNAETSATNISNSPDDVMPDVTLDDSQHREEVKPPVIDHISETLELNETVIKESNPEFDIVQNVTEERDNNAFYEQKEDDVSNFVPTDMSEEQIEITKANLEQEMTNLANERNDLGDEQRRLERNAESVSGEMFAECQELLQMFGLPYIIAPMEAEAQCAYMELENLVDGVVTDDSDVLLFGARSVYKNIFDDRKYVETYFMKDIESELGLTREKLIRMAMLLGSDYTEGISGIGIVNAVEVLNAFPEENGLQNFREWIESPDPNILGLGTKKKGSNTTVGEGVSKLDDEISRMKQIFMDKHRNVSKNWHIPSTFPSDAVISAYASPQVDKSTEPFSWGKPDLFVLRKLCSEKFGWGTQKADELLQPVLKEYNKHETQLRLEAFYTFNERFAKIRSKRISKAVKGIAGSKASELMDHTQIDSSNGKKRKKINHEEVKNDIENGQLTVPNESIQEGTKNTKKKSNVRGRGRGRGQTVGRGRRKKKNVLELSGTSSDDENNDSYVQVVNTENTHGVRKSKRVRKPVISTNIEDSEIDEEPKTYQNHAEVSENEETLVSNDLKSSLSGNGIDPEDVELDKDWCEKDENAPEAELSKEYLFMGGGFCLDDDEGDKEPGISGCSPPPTDGPNANGLNEAAHIEEAETSITPNVATDIATFLPQGNNEEGEDEVRPVTFLSAMPNLKRKRKKV